MELAENTGTCDIKSISSLLYEGKAWIKFIGIVSIVGGGLAALTLIGIVFAWLLIWMGILLVRVANSIDIAYNLEDEAALVDSLKNMKTYFVMSGVLLLIYFVFSILFLLFNGMLSQFLLQMQNNF